MLRKLRRAGRPPVSLATPSPRYCPAPTSRGGPLPDALTALRRIPSIDCAAMKEDKFCKVFDFQYTADQWAQIKRVIDKQPGKHDEKTIRETMELKARQFRVVPQIEANVPRRDNLALANDVVKGCERLKSLLSESNVLREGSFYTEFKSRSEYDAIIDKIDELRDVAKLVAANNGPISQKRKQSDPGRDKYLGALFDLWAKDIGGS